MIKNKNIFNKCILNNEKCNLDKIERLGLNGFRRLLINNTPKKVYKYFPNNIRKGGHNYSLEALENNTIFLNNSTNFDDCYDCAIDINPQKFYKLKLEDYCISYNISYKRNEDLNALMAKIAEFISSQGINENLENLIRKNAIEKENLASQNFYIKVCNELVITKNWFQAVYNVIDEEYKKFKDTLNEFKMSCFSTSPFLNRMWSSSYGNYSKGFCIEYTIDIENYSNFMLTYLNFFPVIYSNIRNDSSKFYTSNNTELNKDKLWQFYFNGLLRKSLDWSDQSEWRLILLNKMIEKDYNGHNPVPFFKISKVYLGNKMSHRNRKKIIEICKKNNIEYVGLIRKENSFILEPCEQDCYNCNLITKGDLFLQYLQKDHPLIKRALTDISYKNYYLHNEKKEYLGQTNKELATLGDSLLKTILCIRLLDEKIPLSKSIEKYITDKILVEVIAKEYDLLKFMRYDQNDEKIPSDYLYSENEETHKYIASAVEAMLGAIYLYNESLDELQEIVEDWVKHINLFYTK